MQPATVEHSQYLITPNSTLWLQTDIDMSTPSSDLSGPDPPVLSGSKSCEGTAA